jgi:hypothetical protein
MPAMLLRMNLIAAMELGVPFAPTRSLSCGQVQQNSEHGHPGLRCAYSGYGLPGYDAKPFSLREKVARSAG